MVTKIFGGKKINIRLLAASDLKNAKKFQEFINSFIPEQALISFDRTVSLKEERDFLKGTLRQIKKHKQVVLVAECDKKVIGLTDIEKKERRTSHVGGFGIAICAGFRGIGLGKYLAEEVIRLAKKEIKPRLKIIRLEVFTTNKPAISLYKKIGFKRVAMIPKALQYKGKLVGEYVMLLEV